jgi:hypothetical protein
MMECGALQLDCEFVIEGERSMATMFIRHTVSDYKAWRKVYDDVSHVQKAGA